MSGRHEEAFFLQQESTDLVMSHYPWIYAAITTYATCLKVHSQLRCNIDHQYAFIMWTGK